MLAGTRQFAKAVVALALPYWKSRERWSARGLLAVIVAMSLGLVYVNVLFSNWNNRFYDALQQHDFPRFIRELEYFCVLAAIFIVIAVYQTYLTQMLEIRWRRWLTDRYLGDWLGGHAYYRLQLGAYHADNPDQRIADDLLLFVESTLTLTPGLLSSVVTLFSFAAILWRLSGTIQVPLGSSHVAIPGYMLWAAMLYAVVGTWLTHRIGRPLIDLNFKRQQFEAHFRFSLARLRENTEAVALYRGEREETRTLSERFRSIVGNWWAIMKRQKRLTWFTAGYNQAAVVFPVLAAAPRYFAGAIQLGALMQTIYAFGQVQSALSWFVTAYTQLAQWKATTDRLTGFRAAIRATEIHAAAPTVERGTGARGLLRIAIWSSTCQTVRRLPEASTPRSGKASAGSSPAAPEPARARCCARSPASGRSVAAASRRRSMLASYSYRRSPIFRSVHCAPRSATRMRRRRSPTMRCATRSRRAGSAISPTGSRNRVTGRSSSPRESSSASRSRASCCSAPTGCSSTRRPRRSTRRASGSSTSSSRRDCRA